MPYIVINELWYSFIGTIPAFIKVVAFIYQFSKPVEDHEIPGFLNANIGWTENIIQAITIGRKRSRHVECRSLNTLNVTVSVSLQPNSFFTVRTNVVVSVSVASGFGMLGLFNSGLPGSKDILSLRFPEADKDNCIPHLHRAGVLQ